MREPNRKGSLQEHPWRNRLVETAAGGLVLFGLLALFISTNSPEANMKLWEEGRDVSRVPIARGWADFWVPSIGEFIQRYDEDFSRLSSQYSVPEGALRELVYRELGRDDSSGLLGLKDLSTQWVKSRFEDILVGTGVYPKDDPRTEFDIGPAIGFTNLHPHLIDKQVIKRIQSPNLRMQMKKGLDKDTGYVEAKYFLESLNSIANEGDRFRTELELNLAIIAARRKPVDDYILRNRVDEETASGLYSLVPFTPLTPATSQEVARTGVGKYGIILRKK